jgi:hypothetical protein
MERVGPFHRKPPFSSDVDVAHVGFRQQRSHALSVRQPHTLTTAASL